MKNGLTMKRELTINILKFDKNCDKKPYLKKYKIPESVSMSLFILLNKIKQTQDHDLSFDFVCRAGICGSCAMVVNGKSVLACKTLTSSLPDTITIMPLAGFEILKDLSVDTGNWMNGMSKRVKSWIHNEEKKDISKIEDKIEPEEAKEVFELDRCIECGICVSSCATKIMRDDFIGAVGLIKVARFKADSRDKRSDADFYELIGDENGIFGCMSLMGCEDNCPKELPLQTKIAYLRRAMVKI